MTKSLFFPKWSQLQIRLFVKSVEFILYLPLNFAHDSGTACVACLHEFFFCEVIGWEHDVYFFWLQLFSRCVLSCRGCSACASGSVWRLFSSVRPLSTTPSNSIRVWGPDGPPSTWSVRPPQVFSPCLSCSPAMVATVFLIHTGGERVLVSASHWHQNRLDWAPRVFD